MLDGLLFIIFSELLVITFTAVLILKEEVDLSGLGLSGNDRANSSPETLLEGTGQTAMHSLKLLLNYDTFKLSLFSFFSL